MAGHLTASFSMIFLIIWIHVAHCDADDINVNSATWRADKNRNVTTFQSMTSAPSGIACVKECMNKDKYSLCETCAYDKDSGTCYLQVQTDQASDVMGKSVIRYTVLQQATCSISGAPVNYTTLKANWQRTENRLEGELGCLDDDFVYVGDNPALTCTGLGVWTKKEGECKQRIWRNQPAQSPASLYPVPMKPEAGWALCLYGNLSMNFPVISSTVRLMDNADSYLVGLEFNDTSNTNKYELQLHQCKAFTPPPQKHCYVVSDQVFDLRIVAVALKSVEVYINGVMCSTCELFKPLDNLEDAKVRKIDIVMLDLLCKQSKQ